MGVLVETISEAGITDIIHSKYRFFTPLMSELIYGKIFPLAYEDITDLLSHFPSENDIVSYLLSYFISREPSKPFSYSSYELFLKSCVIESYFYIQNKDPINFSYHQNSEELSTISQSLGLSECEGDSIKSSPFYYFINYAFKLRALDSIFSLSCASKENLVSCQRVISNLIHGSSPYFGSLNSPMLRILYLSYVFWETFSYSSKKSPSNQELLFDLGYFERFIGAFSPEDIFPLSQWSNPQFVVDFGNPILFNLWSLSKNILDVASCSYQSYNMEQRQYDYQDYSNLFMLKDKYSSNHGLPPELVSGLGATDCELDLDFSLFKDYGIESSAEAKSMLLCFSSGLPSHHLVGSIVGDD